MKIVFRSLVQKQQQTGLDIWIGVTRFQRKRQTSNLYRTYRIQNDRHQEYSILFGCVAHGGGQYMRQSTGNSQQ